MRGEAFPLGAPALELRAASERDVDLVFEIYKACTAAMLARGIRQWDDGYPSRETAAAAARRGDLFLLVRSAGAEEPSAAARGARAVSQDVKREDSGDALAGEVVGSVILNDVPAEEYAPIEWREAGPALVIHTLVIDPRRQGGGLGRAAMACCEAFGQASGYACVRLDAFPGNPAAIALYERLGYQLRGHVRFGFKPPGHERYAVYEKALPVAT
jgi:ribosomal protein S18 acetylase RimI-like enzyme